SLAEQIRQYAAVADGHVLLKIGHDEAHFHAAALALEAALFDHAAEPEHTIDRSLARGHVCRRVVIEKVVLERGQSKGCRRAHSKEDEPDQNHATASRCHRHVRSSFCISTRRRAAPICSVSQAALRSRRRISLRTRSHSTAAK